MNRKGYREFFLIWCVFSVFLVFYYGVIPSEIDFQALGAALLIWVASGAVLAFVGYWFFEHVRPWYLKEKRLDLPTFKFLVDSGFRKEDKQLVGVYKGYFARAFWAEGNPLSGEEKGTYSVRIVFHFYSPSFNPTPELVDNCKQSEQIILHAKTVEGVLESGRRRLPSQDRLRTKADRIIQLMQTLGLEPGMKVPGSLYS